jgi:phytoene synthase
VPSGSAPVFIGLTGAIAAGKSEALAALERLGAATLSTDAVVHALYGEDQVRDAVVERFGAEVAPDGALDRAALAERVFGDDEARAWLEAALWPRVGERVAAWRAEVEALYAGRPRRWTTLALLEPVARFTLPRTEFEAMIDGMEMDAAERMRAPGWAELERYCRCVAGAVGLLSVRVFGVRGDGFDQGALALGEALQLTNVLRDLAEDAGRGRLYLPQELLLRYGVGCAEPGEALGHPALPAVCEGVAERARERFAQAERWLKGAERRRLRPALIMMQIYRRLLERLMARGWQRLDQPVRVARAERLWLAVRYGLF